MTRPMSVGTKRNARVRGAIYTRKSSARITAVPGRPFRRHVASHGTRHRRGLADDLGLPSLPRGPFRGLAEIADDESAQTSNNFNKIV
jgi:hypothetical protein